MGATDRDSLLICISSLLRSMSVAIDLADDLQYGTELFFANWRRW